MEKPRTKNLQKLEVISEMEPHSHNGQRTNYNMSPSTHVQINDSKDCKTSLPPTQGGRINHGYIGNSQISINRDGSTPSNIGVYREQYWVCSEICSEPLRCRNWTKRERILFFVLLGLSTIVLGLVAVISFISRNSRDPTESPPSWIPWL